MEECTLVCTWCFTTPPSHRTSCSTYNSRRCKNCKAIIGDHPGARTQSCSSTSCQWIGGQPFPPASADPGHFLSGGERFWWTCQWKVVPDQESEYTLEWKSWEGHNTNPSTVFCSCHPHAFEHGFSDMRPSTAVDAHERCSLHHQEVLLQWKPFAVAPLRETRSRSGCGGVTGVQITTHTHTHTFARHWSRTAIFEKSYYRCSGSTPKSCLAIMGRSKAQCQLSYLLMLVWRTIEGCDSGMSLSQGHESMAHFNTLGGSILCVSSPDLT